MIEHRNNVYCLGISKMWYTVIMRKIRNYLTVNFKCSKKADDNLEMRL